ncbi:MAG: type III pantothenate kinase [Chitinispirillales bacterium]|jgi:type III pantothenate kinase|nr:type III pantothenate kinase [Chitinispirillales bacterium]
MNSHKPSILAIDIGSTQTHIAAVCPQKMSCTDRIDFENAEFDTHFSVSIKQIVSINTQIRRVNITSCIKKMAAKAKEICEDKKTFDEITIIDAQKSLPITINYENSHLLGTDRICNAIACAALFDGQNCIIVDSGTAITVDCLRSGKVFEGGAILPGVTMQINALHHGTDALPLVPPVVISTSIPALGTSTAGCIAAGVFYGAAAAVDRLIAEYLDYLSVDGNSHTQIITTGGGWRAIEPLIRHKTVNLPNLTLIGTAIVGI